MDMGMGHGIIAPYELPKKSSSECMQPDPEQF